jgi:all-trans-retinol dehydrogenase (NAD+)
VPARWPWPGALAGRRAPCYLLRAVSEYAGQRVLVTGAASGLGRLVAGRMAAAGAQAILWDVNAAGLEDARRELAARGYEVATYVCDLTDRHAVAEVAARVLAEGGPVDILVNNAGVVTGKSLLDASPEAIERTFAVNTLALFWTTRAFLPAMLERDHGHVVTIASAAGLIGTAKMTDYAASKHAAVGFDESLRLELRQRGSRVRTTVVCPFYVATGMFTGVRSRFRWLLPILDPDRVADRIVDAVRRDRRRVILPWVVRTIWLGRLVLPVAAFDAVTDFLGVTRSMDEFTGRAGG